LINAYSQYERHGKPLELFFDMLADGHSPDEATFLSVSSGCAHQCALTIRETVHAYLLKINIRTDIALAITLLERYAKNS
jgi:pentatricopeptide repeat protein